MDRRHLEPGLGLPDDLAWLHELLCHADGRAVCKRWSMPPTYRDRKSGNRQVWTGKLHFNDAALEIPFRWRQPRRVFVNSMSDLFQDGVPADFIKKVWAVMERAHWHSFQVLTKRPDNMRDVLKAAKLPVLRNVWLGTSVESADYVDRIKFFRTIPAKVRFISFEPLLGAVGSRTSVAFIGQSLAASPARRRVRWMRIGSPPFKKIAKSTTPLSSSSSGAA